MKKSIIIGSLLVALFMNSCHIYKSYSRPDEVDATGLYRDPVVPNDTLVSDTTTMADLPWEEVFTDPLLQKLIRKGLSQNANLRTAALRVKQANAQLLTAKMAYAPTLTLSPQGTVSGVLTGDYKSASAQWGYQIPLSASWEIDIFGRLLNAKRGAKAALMQSEAYEQAVRTQVVATIATSYYTLLMLDRQLALSEETAEKWELNVQTMRAMKEAGRVKESAVVQSEANSYMIAATLPELRSSIRETENALSILLAEPPHAIERGRLEDQVLPEKLSAGVPVQLLANRPDVKSAEMNLAVAYYNRGAAAAAFYPQIVISGQLGWTNTLGGQIMNPAQWIASAVGALTQPLLARGANIARLKVAKAQQEEALISFQQSLLNAGSEVSNALRQYQAAEEKIEKRKLQINSLEKSVEYTQELLTFGTATYLEVLTAQQSLLSAQLSEVSDTFQRMKAVVTLYQALGGGRE